MCIHTVGQPVTFQGRKMVLLAAGYPFLDRRL